MSGKKHKAMKKAVKAEIRDQVLMLFVIMCRLGFKHRCKLAWKLLIGDRGATNE